MGKVPLDWIKIPPNVNDWESYETEDIFTTNFINFPNDYMLTLGSAVHPSYSNIYSSLATTPGYKLPISSQFYVAGRDVIRWGGTADPEEVDFDRYVFTPLTGEDFAAVSKAPKSEPHHLSDAPELMDVVSDAWKEIFEGIKNGKFK